MSHKKTLGLYGLKYIFTSQSFALDFIFIQTNTCFEYIEAFESTALVLVDGYKQSSNDELQVVSGNT